MKNKLSDLNNHLFAQLERLSDESLKPEQLAVEIQRAGAIKDIAREVISNANLLITATINLREHQVPHYPDILGIKNDNLQTEKTPALLHNRTKSVAGRNVSKTGLQTVNQAI